MADSKHFYSKDLTECGICLSTLDEPKALPCLHSYCLKCLTEWAEKGAKDSVSCPLCVQDFPIPANGVQGFRTNFFINTLKERRETAEKLQAKDALVPCACCGAADNAAEAFCTSCGGFVCGECVGIHGKVKSMDSHKLVPFDDLRSGKVDMRSLSQQKVCKQHTGQSLWFYCETCGILICRDCTVVDHPASTHVLVNLESATKRQKSEIRDLIENCEKVKMELADAFNEVQTVLLNLTENTAEADLEIDRVFEEYRKSFVKKLEENKSALKAEAKQVNARNRKELEAQKGDIQLQQTRLTTSLLMAKEVTETGSDYDLAVAFSSLMNSLSQIRDISPTPIQRHLEKVAFQPTPVEDPALPCLGCLSLGHRKEGLGIWKLEREFGRERLSAPHGIAVSPDRDVFVADATGRSVLVYDNTGEFKSHLSTSSEQGGACAIPKPWDVVVSPDGQVFVTNRTRYVSVYDNKANYSNQFPTRSSSGVASSKQVATHMGLALDRHGHLLVGESKQKYISKHQLDGAHISTFKVSIKPSFIAVSRQNRLIISDGKQNRVQILDGTSGQVIHELTSPLGRKWNPHGLCCTPDDEVYVASYYDSPGVFCYSSKSGEYLGCITKDVYLPVGLALTGDGDKLLVAQDKRVKTFTLQ